jgi:hypothetical protein
MTVTTAGSFSTSLKSNNDWLTSSLGLNLDSSRRADMGAKFYARKWLREPARSVANKLVSLSDVQGRLMAVQHQGLAGGLDFSQDPRTQADGQLRRAVSLMLPTHQPKAKWCRVGGPADGGYVMAQDFTGAVAVSMGVGWDDSWDADALQLGASSLAQFDPTIRRPPRHLKNTEFYRLGIAAESDSAHGKVSLIDALKLAEPSGNQEVVVKMDIEGHEWTVLDNATQGWASSCRQIVAELHCWSQIGEAEFAETALRVLERLGETHVPVHLRANNAVPLVSVGAYATPSALEVTWLRRDLAIPIEPLITLRHVLDAPNDPRTPEVNLDGWLSG